MRVGRPYTTARGLETPWARGGRGDAHVCPMAEELEIADAKAALRRAGWFVRYTEWPTGHQVVLHRRSDTSAHVVTSWRASEVEAWREALALALRERRGDDAAIQP